MEALTEWWTTTGIKLAMNAVGAVVILVLGRIAAGVIKSITTRLMNRANQDEILVKFVANIVYALVIVFVVIAALGKLGVQTASFVAIVGAAGLAIGFALQGSLSNFAAGVLMIIFKPFKAGDFIEAAGTSGIVEEISIFTTQIRTGDNKTIIIPNAQVTGGSITNYSAKDTRRVDMVVGVSYSDDLQKTRDVLAGIIAQDDRILSDPEPTIAVSELADSSVNLVVRPWVNSEDYWGVLFDLTQKIKERFDEENISIPFPQQDVHMFQASA